MADYENVGGEVDGEDGAFDCAVGWVGGLNANAGCGDWVSILGGSRRNATRLDHFIG